MRGASPAGVRPWILTDACASNIDRAGHDAGLLVGRRLIGSAQLITTREFGTRAGLR